MADIVLLTFNARYHHASFGLRYLRANLAELQAESVILEFDLEKRPADALEAVLDLAPRIVALSVYIWNTRQALEFAALLKAVRPDLRLIIGGPEVSHETDRQPLAQLADHVLCGEGDLAFRDLCRAILAGEHPPRIILCPPPDLAEVMLPYDQYADEDLQHRTIYVESSRGCPFACEFCLSSLEIPVRRFPLARFLPAMQRLLDRGCRQFKFVDRTFNVHTEHACDILRFFLDRLSPSRPLFLHFEMIPDRLPDAVRDLLAMFPPGSIQLEIGIQTFDEAVAQRIGRKQDNAAAEANLRFLREQTHAHLHADLIAGLPGESLESFAAGFDRLLALRPHEIQVGILKRLRGAPIARHTADYGMVYSPEAPYDLLCNNLLDFHTMQRLKRLARYWDLFANSGNFADTLPLLWSRGQLPFYAFLAFADHLYATTGKTHQIALPRQFELLYDYLMANGADATATADALARDFRRPGRRDLPTFLDQLQKHRKGGDSAPPVRGIPARQARHMGQ